jgi:hypothetical protein
MAASGVTVNVGVPKDSGVFVDDGSVEAGAKVGVEVGITVVGAAQETRKRIESRNSCLYFIFSPNGFKESVS